MRKNAKALAKGLMDRGHKLVSGGTDNHLMLWDVRPLELTGSKVEKACELVHITVNKNTIIGDKSAVTPGGVRLGTPALTSRGMKEEHMDKVAEFLDRTTKICSSAQKKGGKNLKQFMNVLQQSQELKILANDVQEFATQFYIPGDEIENINNFKC